mmetsp:Transcript_4550/g.13122  ORF Transcript_4550/g.13122 Transcript_4550/m.13122 type:complete len:100 (-) Transcript_4550:112-411(-)
MFPDRGSLGTGMPQSQCPDQAARAAVHAVRGLVRATRDFMEEAALWPDTVQRLLDAGRPPRAHHALALALLREAGRQGIRDPLHLVDYLDAALFPVSRE